jgi:decaprenyl-phosphate phosphoribosyltransferase
MGSIFLAILRTARPRQWLKNLGLFATILVTGHIFEGPAFLHTVWGFGVFCLLSSSNYLFNDVMDAPRDKKHPFKKFRPVASGQLPIPIAICTSVIFAIIGLIVSYSLGQTFFFLSLVFIILEYSYTLFFKHISLIDILAITGAYFLRVYAGEALTGYHISVWLALAAFSLALFLAIGKRRAELTLIQRFSGVVTSDTRASLSHYSEKLLDTYTAMFANSTFITYAFYTFLERPVNQGFFFRGYSDFASDLPGRKWLMISIPFVLYGIMRYMQLIYEGKGESPEQVLLSDKPLLVTIFLWVVGVFLVIYGIGG